MPTVVVANGYAVRIFTRDHGPAHVHVQHAGTVMKITLSPITIVSFAGRRPTARERREAMLVVALNRGASLAAWASVHG